MELATAAEASGSNLVWTPRALVVADLTESVPLIRDHPNAVIGAWRAFVASMERDLLPARRGRMVKSYGDGFLLEFGDCGDVAEVVIALHQRMKAVSDGLRLDGKAMRLRIGAHFGEVAADVHDVYGHAVNLAQRLSTLAEPGETIISPELMQRLLPGIDAEIEDLGLRYVKHLDEPLHVYRLGPVMSGGMGLLSGARLTDLKAGIAVLPFECGAGDDDARLLGHAVADDVIARIARSAEWHVISGLSTRALAGRAVDLGFLAQHLGVAYVLSGSYNIRAGRAHFSLELADTRSQRVVWSDTLEAHAATALDAEEALAERVVGAIARAVLQHELDLAQAQPLPALPGYTLLFGAINLMHRSTSRDFDRAHDMLVHLVERQRHLL